MKSRSLLNNQYLSWKVCEFFFSWLKWKLLDLLKARWCCWYVLRPRNGAVRNGKITAHVLFVCVFFWVGELFSCPANLRSPWLRNMFVCNHLRRCLKKSHRDVKLLFLDSLVWCCSTVPKWVSIIFQNGPNKKIIPENKNKNDLLGKKQKNHIHLDTG